MNRRLGYGAAAIAAGLAALWLLLRPCASEPAASGSAKLAAPQPTAKVSPLPTTTAGSGATTTPGQPTPANSPSATSHKIPKATIRIAFESEPRDAAAAAAEARLRAIYAAEPGAEGVLRDVRCTQTVCKIEARWSNQLNRGYNAALLKIIHEFSKEISLEPGGPPDATATPIAIYVRRPAANTAQH